jgi:hypothetical protein
VAKVDDKVRLQSVETWFDPLEMFRQIAPEGVVKRETQERGDGYEEATTHEELSKTAPAECPFLAKEE